MKKVNLVLLAVVFSMTIMSCSRVAPNYEGVLMTHYGRNGMSDFRLVTGKVSTIAPGTELFQVPMYEQKADPALIAVNTKDIGYFSIDPTYSYQALRGKGVEIIFNYKQMVSGKDFMDNIEDNVLNPLVLNAYKEEARNYTTDSLLTNMNLFENRVEQRLIPLFQSKFFEMLPNTLTSGITLPQTMVDAINLRNNVKIETEKTRLQLEQAEMNLQKARIDAERDKVKSAGLTREILMNNWIEAIRNSPNTKIIITDGKSIPFLVQ